VEDALKNKSQGETKSWHSPLSYGGEPPPQVDPDDLKRVWRRQREFAILPSIRAAAFAKDLSPSADVKAVWFRASFLHMLIRQGLLAPWVGGDEPAGILFEVFATYPVHLGDFDTEPLLRHIRARAS
jgi:hypothetical protein